MGGEERCRRAHKQHFRMWHMLCVTMSCATTDRCRPFPQSADSVPPDNGIHRLYYTNVLGRPPRHTVHT